MLHVPLDAVGVELDAQTSMSEQADGFEFQVSRPRVITRLGELTGSRDETTARIDAEIAEVLDLPVEIVDAESGEAKTISASSLPS